MMMQISKMLGRPGLVLAKHSPTIMVYGGTVGLVVATVLACKATRKCEEVLLTHEKKIIDIKKAAEIVSVEDYSLADQKQDTTVTYVQTAWEFVKLYAPSAALGALSIGLILTGHNILKKRHVLLMGAYKALEECYTAYRSRVCEEYGAEKDELYWRGLYEEEITVDEVDENGKTKKVKKIQCIPGNRAGSPYARLYTQGCKSWSPNMDYNMMFLKNAQTYWNNMLKLRGHVFLMEVYDALGIPRTSASARVGWFKDSVTGDGHIDFGFNRIEDMWKNRKYYNGETNEVLLDFNVDGDIWQLLDERI